MTVVTIAEYLTGVGYSCCRASYPVKTDAAARLTDDERLTA